MTCIGISNSSPSYNHVTVEGKRYEDRACCESGGIVPSDSCPATLSNSTLMTSEETEETDNTGLIVGITAAAVIFVLALLIFLWKKKSSQATTNTKTGTDKTGPGAEINVASSIYEMDIMMPPSAPVNPVFSGEQTQP